MPELAAGTRLGPYEILEQIGAGGMGEVYRATDTRLKRQVALKVLPSSVTGDPDRLARFQREAEVLASLNHPNIAGLYGLEENPAEAGHHRRALVMELVEGPTLADRIAQGPLPLVEALPIARQIAEALEAAHEQGVIHRDLKPANIKLRPDGTVKVLDFGLAKAMDQGSGIEDQGSGNTRLANSPTITSPAMTMHGVILGTAAYMSPEQAAGKPVDRRTDLWAFGVVLMEMLTGRPVFAGETVSHVIAAVLKDEPDWKALPADTPPPIQRLLRRCLERDRKKRWPDAAAARMECDDALTGGHTATAIAGSAAVVRSPWHLAGALVAGVMIAGIAAWTRWPAAPAAPAVTTFGVDLPIDQAFTRTGRHAVALSPDGMRMVYVANQQLFIRSLGELTVKPLAGTAAADPSEPTFSPDGEWIAFWSNGFLKKIPVNDGAPLSLAEVRNPMGVSWSGDRLVLGQESPPAIVEVPASGGPAKTLIAGDPGKGELMQSPQLIGGGRAVLFTLRTGVATWNDADIVVQDLATSTRAVLVHGGTDGRVTTNGRLLYSRDDTLFAMLFDEDRRSVTGPAVQVRQQILASVGGFTGATQLAVSTTGTLAYIAGGPSGQDRVLAWMNRQGKVQATSLPVKRYWPGGPGLSVSPDGKMVATRIMGPAGTDSDIWIWEVGRDALVRLTTTGTATDPVWTPDGRRVCYESADTLFCQPYDGSGPPQALFKNDRLSTITSISGDGRSLLLSMTAQAGLDIWVADNTPPFDTRPLINSAIDNEHSATFSPDGRWFAYVSDEAGAEEVYVRPFPAISEARWQVSTKGGVAPRWSRDGRELYFLSSRTAGTTLSSTLLAVPILRGEGFVTGPAVTIAPFPNRVRASYDATPDGRFVISVPAISEITDGGAQQRIVIVQNWFEELKAKVPR